MKNFKNVFLIFMMSVALVSVMLYGLFHTPVSFSATERRPLAQAPNFNLKQFVNGKFAKDFESYTLDQFPFRDGFRSIKAGVHFYFFRQKDNNDLYLHDGYIAKMEYPLDEASVKRATNVFSNIYELYLKDKNTKIYSAVIPDKNYFLAEKSGHLMLDYERMLTLFREEMPYAKYLDIFPFLSVEDYYHTDTHWRQECLFEVAGFLADAMGARLNMTYEAYKINQPFYGVYYGQLGLPVEPDHMMALYNKEMNLYTVTDRENNKTISVFESEKLNGNDMYEAFLGGPLSLVTIENKKSTGKKLIVFRDSYASAIAPLLAEAYEEITLIDVRYINSRFLEDIVTFEGCDVLFLYSSMVLNNSETLK